MIVLAGIGFVALILCLFFGIQQSLSFLTQVEEDRRRLTKLELQLQDTKLDVDLLQRHTKIL